MSYRAQNYAQLDKPQNFMGADQIEISFQSIHTPKLSEDKTEHSSLFTR